LDAASNLVLGASAQTAPAVFASLVREQGSHRFVFGSGTSDLADGTAFALVAGLASDADAEAILSRNADLLDAGDWDEMFL
jgi:hypothetical protein